MIERHIAFRTSLRSSINLSRAQAWLGWKRRVEHTHILTSIRRPKLRKICI